MKPDLGFFGPYHLCRRDLEDSISCTQQACRGLASDPIG